MKTKKEKQISDLTWVILQITEVFRIGFNFFLVILLVLILNALL